MSNKAKKKARRDKLNMLVTAYHNLLVEARKLRVSMRRLRKMFPDSFFTGKRFRAGTPGAFGYSGFASPSKTSESPRRGFLCGGNAHDRRIARRRQARHAGHPLSCPTS